MTTRFRWWSCVARTFSLMPMLCVLAQALPADAQTASISHTHSRQPNIDPLVTTTVEHYEIRGVSFDDIRRELDAKGHGGAGSTTGEVTYRFKSEKKDDRCEILEVRASCTTKVRLPRWYDVSKTPVEIQEYWKGAYNKLKKHEMGHVDICVEVAKDVEKAIWSIASGPHCSYVNQEARMRADALVRGMNARQRAFDEREYGGAVRK